ncbi:hypothetical protein PoB_002384300 [Plakobranchus ocellatus]|uniref:Uncharacterized protein n=1 Tax=Plakobranchus ocellatus TaxID=259542 RepID=A0AAV3ZR67_9GAST|nr:hypothetical protein PoB_002384300 [Plakobranchus ocellatus]
MPYFKPGRSNSRRMDLCISQTGFANHRSTDAHGDDDDDDKQEEKEKREEKEKGRGEARDKQGIGAGLKPTTGRFLQS